MRSEKPTTSDSSSSSNSDRFFGICLLFVSISLVLLYLEVMKPVLQNFDNPAITEYEN